MNLDTLLDIFGRSIEIVIKRIEKRREVPVCRHPLADTREDIGGYIIGEPNIEDVLLELQQISTLSNNEDLMAYRGNIYDELFDKLNTNNHGGIEATVIDVLRPFREYSYSMFPDTLCKKILDVFDGSTNESCIKHLHNPTPEMMTNAKAIVLEHEKDNAYARGRFFEGYIGNILSEDIVIRTASYLHYYVVKFAVMLDCVLLQSGYDLLELQNLHNIKLIDEHKEMLLSEYVDSNGYVKKLLAESCKNNKDNIQSIPELDTPDAKKYFEKAIDLGLMKLDGSKYKWNRSIALLGLFLGIIVCGDSIVYGNWYGDKWQLGTKNFPDRKLGKLFGVNNLGQQRINNLDSKRQKNPPRGYEEIMKVFE